jgi:hypothetical protein
MSAVKGLSNTTLFIRTVVYCSQDNSVGIVTGYWLDNQGSVLSKGKIFFSTTQYPD